MLYYVYSDERNDEYTVNITPVELTITGVQAIDRNCNGTNLVELTGGTLNGIVRGDDVTAVLGTGTVADKYSGNDKKVTTDIKLAGADAANYVLIQPDYVTVNITCTPEKVEAKDPTCTQKGNKEYWYCPDCDLYYANEDLTKLTSLSEVTLATIPHDTEIKNAVAATATKEGYTGDKVCKVCGTVVEIGKVIPATGTTDTKPDTQPETKPQEQIKTGENSNLYIWVIVLAAACVAVVCLIVYNKKVKSRSEK